MPCIVILSGAAGTGKTTFAESFSTAAAMEGGASVLTIGDRDVDVLRDHGNPDILIVETCGSAQAVEQLVVSNRVVHDDVWHVWFTRDANAECPESCDKCVRGIGDHMVVGLSMLIEMRVLETPLLQRQFLEEEQEEVQQH